MFDSKKIAELQRQDWGTFIPENYWETVAASACVYKSSICLR